MKVFNIGILIIMMCIWNTVKAQDNELPAILNSSSCEINFTPSITTTDLELFVKQYNATCANPLEVDLILKTDQVNFRRLPSVYDPSQDVIPSQHNYYQSPSLQIGNYSDFQGRFQWSNLAFYEANRSSIMSSGYETFISTERNFGN